MHVCHALQHKHMSGCPERHTKGCRTTAAVLDAYRRQDTTGPTILRGLPSSCQQRGEGNVLNAQLQGLQSDVPRMSAIREGCPQQGSSGQLGASGLALRDL